MVYNDYNQIWNVEFWGISPPPPNNVGSLFAGQFIRLGLAQREDCLDFDPQLGYPYNSFGGLIAIQAVCSLHSRAYLPSA
jgi:hypothetical protein